MAQSNFSHPHRVIQNRSVAAFFDLDNTLITGSSFYYLVRGLVDKGIITRRQIARFSLENFKYVRCRKENPNTISDVTRKALNVVKGMRVHQLQGICAEIVREFLPQRIVPEMQERIDHHRRAGDDTWLITATPQEIAEIVALELGMTGGFGTRTAVENGMYEDFLDSSPVHGPNKAELIRRLAHDRGYDLTASFAYGDSLNDLPMLVAVGRPHPVNPEKELARIATKNQWQIIETRSNTVLANSR